LTDWFVCPLCGHQRTISGWDPSGYDNEIKIRDVRGRGKGRGSEVASEWTVDVNSAGLDITAMARRSLKIVELCLNTGWVFASDFVDDTPAQLIDEIVENKAEEHGYTKEYT